MRTARSERRSHYTRTLLVVPGSSDDAATQRSGRGNGRGEPAEGLSKYTMMSCLQRHVSTLLSSDTCPRPSRLATWPGGSPWISSVAAETSGCSKARSDFGTGWCASWPGLSQSIKVAFIEYLGKTHHYAAAFAPFASRQ